MAYVAYVDLGSGPGAVVNETDFDPVDWQYHVDHGNVVLRGSENDPNVLAARAAGEAYIDPRDQEIADLKAQLAALQDPPAEEIDNSKGPVDPADQMKTDQKQAKQGEGAASVGQ